jgi:DNA-binding NarL/FixJ family response regulator
MSSSKHDSDVRQSYSLGASTYFVKPTTFDALATIVQAVHEYWALSTKPQPTNRAYEGADFGLHREVSGHAKWK